MYKAIQIEGTFELLNTQTIQAQWFKSIYKMYAKTRGYKENHLHKPVLRKIKEIKHIHRNTIMTAVENAYAMAEWRLKDPDVEDNKQIADKLTSEEREKWWPVMLAHKTWETKDWQATDNVDKKGEIVENEDEEPEGRKKRRYKPYLIRKPGKGKQQRECEARRIIGEGQRIKNAQEKAQFGRAKQLQEQAKLTILEDTENWIACDKCKKWRKSDKLGAYRVTCKTMNRKCEEVADDEETEEDGEEKAWEKAKLSQTEWLEQIQKWKEKYSRITDKRIKELYKICRAKETDEREEDEETNSQTKEGKDEKNEEEIETRIKEKQKDLIWI